MMAKDSGSTILILGAVGVAVYGWYQGWFASLLGTPASASSVPAATTAGAATPTAAPAAASTPASPAAPAGYGGPSLAQMFAALQSAVAASYGSDPALSCGSSGNLSGLGLVRLVGGPVLRTPGGATSPSAGAPAGSSAPASSQPATCSNPIASTYDVFNWYLVNRANVGVSSAPTPPPNNGPVSLSDYWAWAAPLLQAQMPGLAGLGHVYRGLGLLVHRMRGW